MSISSYTQAPQASTTDFLFASQQILDFAKRKKHILLVEDNPLLQHFHSLWLEDLNYDITVVDSGEDALAKNLSNYDLVLMDLDLPGADGITTTKALLKKIKIPVIACTSHAASEMKDACISAGMVGYLQKPISLSLLKKTLATHSI